MSRLGSRLTEDLIHDLRLALHALRRAPGFAAAVILTLRLGIGANTAMFGVVDRLMFRPYPSLRDPSSVHRIYLRAWNRCGDRTAPRRPRGERLAGDSGRAGGPKPGAQG
jgi:hypothetical protein